jgi:RNA polymerase subunit RPABC4/transcription elongation factor Spt4
MASVLNFQACAGCGRHFNTARPDCPFCGRSTIQPVQAAPTPPQAAPGGTLIDCPACGRVVSARAQACPHCGDPLGRAVRANWWLIGAMWIMSALSIAMMTLEAGGGAVLAEAACFVMAMILASSKNSTNRANGFAKIAYLIIAVVLLVMANRWPWQSGFGH